ncbi:DUF4861 family protein [Planctomycetota bacterium]
MQARNSLFLVLLALVSLSSTAFAANHPWYTEGKFKPDTRIVVTLVNPLDIARESCPVMITPDQMPNVNLYEHAVTVVDPALPPRPEPSKELLGRQGVHQLRGETNGRFLPYQLDDLNKDGLWDELFFMADFAPNERKTIHLYIGKTQRGWVEHGTYAGLGSYCRRTVPWWESKDIGWKLWYTTDCDLYGKRERVLMAADTLTKNLNGYGVPYDHGSDIMSVSSSFGAGGMCLFEDPAHPEITSRARFSPYAGKGPMEDARFAQHVVVNGPLRSIIRVHTMHWRTGNGEYELEQLYTAYKDKNYSTCQVNFLNYAPSNPQTQFGCGIRKIMEEFKCVQKGGMVISCGSGAEISDPDDDQDYGRITIDFVGTALVVKDAYQPQYQFVPTEKENHCFRIPASKDRSFEYMIAGAWSEGSVLKTAEEFESFVRKSALEYNNPIVSTDFDTESKAK